MKQPKTTCRPIVHFCIAFCVLACGYKPLVGTLPGESTSIVIPIAKNRTAFSNLAAPLTAALRRKACEAGLRVENKAARAAVLDVTVVKVNGEAGMLKAEEENLVPIDKIWSIDVEAELRDSDGNVVVSKESFSASGRAFVVSALTSEEAVGKERRAALMDDIADAIVQFLFF